MKHIDVMFTRTNDGDYIADFDCAQSELPESNVFFFQAISAVDFVRSEASGRTAAELSAQLNQCNAYLQSAIEERNRAEFELSSARNTLRDIANGKYADPQNFAAVWINAHSFEPDVQA